MSLNLENEVYEDDVTAAMSGLDADSDSSLYDGFQSWFSPQEQKAEEEIQPSEESEVKSGDPVTSRLLQFANSLPDGQLKNFLTGVSSLLMRRTQANVMAQEKREQGLAAGCDNKEHASAIAFYDDLLHMPEDSAFKEIGDSYAQIFRENNTEFFSEIQMLADGMESSDLTAQEGPAADFYNSVRYAASEDPVMTMRSINIFRMMGRVKLGFTYGFGSDEYNQAAESLDKVVEGMTQQCYDVTYNNEMAGKPLTPDQVAEMDAHRAANINVPYSSYTPLVSTYYDGLQGEYSAGQLYEMQVQHSAMVMTSQPEAGSMYRDRGGMRMSRGDAYAGKDITAFTFDGASVSEYVEANGFQNDAHMSVNPLSCSRDVVSAIGSLNDNLISTARQNGTTVDVDAMYDGYKELLLRLQKTNDEAVMAINSEYADGADNSIGSGIDKYVAQTGLSIDMQNNTAMIYQSMIQANENGLQMLTPERIAELDKLTELTGVDVSFSEYYSTYKETGEFPVLSDIQPIQSLEPLPSVDPEGYAGVETEEDRQLIEAIGEPDTSSIYTGVTGFGHGSAVIENPYDDQREDPVQIINPHTKFYPHQVEPDFVPNSHAPFDSSVPHEIPSVEIPIQNVPYAGEKSLTRQEMEARVAEMAEKYDYEAQQAAAERLFGDDGLGG